jgi:hypothetical protein
MSTKAGALLAPNLLCKVKMVRVDRIRVIFYHDMIQAMSYSISTFLTRNLQDG